MGIVSVVGTRRHAAAAAPAKRTQENTKMHKKLKSTILTALAVGTAGLAIPLAVAGEQGKKESKDIVAVAMGNKDFTTLVAAVKAAGLVETLQGEGPFTVFAPTDAAFAALPEGTVEMLLEPENREKLAGILTYHVVPGKVMAADVKAGKVKTVNGEKATVKVADGGVMIDGANVVATDVAASNGVIHVIDAVIMPGS